MTSRFDFSMATEANGHLVTFYLTPKGNVYIRITRYRPYHVILGNEAILLAQDLVPVKLWPAFATNLANTSKAPTQGELF